MKTVLVTGGAGYIGSHALFHLASQGYTLIVYDNLSKGYQQVIDVLSKQFPSTITFYKGDLLEKEILQNVFSQHSIDAVMHFAAFCSVSESVENPRLYYTNNVIGSLNLFEQVLLHNISQVVFSSTCAVYGNSQYLPIDENHPLQPVNPYGWSKFMVERILEDYQRAYGIHYVILRYFNVCGAQKDGILGDSKKPSVHLMQNAVRGALGLGEFFYTCPKVDTPDGTTIRDYIDVNDLARAHIAALAYLDAGNPSDIFNVGSASGYSTKEIVDTVEKVTGKHIERNVGEPRKGEYAAIYAATGHAKEKLQWAPTVSLQESVENLVKWYEKHPDGWEY